MRDKFELILRSRVEAWKRIVGEDRGEDSDVEIEQIIAARTDTSAAQATLRTWESALELYLVYLKTRNIK